MPILSITRPIYSFIELLFSIPNRVYIETINTTRIRFFIFINYLYLKEAFFLRKTPPSFCPLLYKVTPKKRPSSEEP